MKEKEPNPDCKVSGHQNSQESNPALKETMFEQTARDEMHNPFSIEEKGTKCDHIEG